MAEFLFYTKFDCMLSLSMLVYSTCLMILLYSNNELTTDKWQWYGGWKSNVLVGENGNEGQATTSNRTKYYVLSLIHRF